MNIFIKNETNNAMYIPDIDRTIQPNEEIDIVPIYLVPFPAISALMTMPTTTLYQKRESGEISVRTVGLQELSDPRSPIKGIQFPR